MGCRLTCPCKNTHEEDDLYVDPPLSMNPLPLPTQRSRPQLRPPPPPLFNLPPPPPQRAVSVSDDSDFSDQISDSEIVFEREKCYDSIDRSLTFVDREDEHDFLCEGFSSRRALMSCGHSVTPQSLTNWCQRQLNEGKNSFLCGMPNCSTAWSYEEVCKMALLTENERSSFEQQMFRNVSFKELDAKICPGCRSCVVRSELTNLCVQCPQCSTDKKRDFNFCWQCLKEWRGPAPRADHCENRGCTNQALVTLRTCRSVRFSDVRGVSGCPSVRACPTCGLLVQHNGESCKNITCPDCKVEFCFVCLKITTECLKDSDYFVKCKSGVAPRQTTICYRNM